MQTSKGRNKDSYIIQKYSRKLNIYQDSITLKPILKQLAPSRNKYT